MALLDEFLGHRIETAAEATVDWYRHFLTSFGRFVGRDLMLDALRPSHVTDWLKQHPDWSSSTKKTARFKRFAPAFAGTGGKAASRPIR